MLLWFALQASTDLDAAMARYREQTRATIECQSAKPDDIVICSRRATDRFRLPLIEFDPYDRKNEPVAVERDRLLARTNNCEEMSTFLVGCGKAGVGFSTRGGGLRGLGERPIAP
ncbi:MAG: hypothetical protein E7773_02625 [Sphingomonas sp.]|uniref:hypothetical protein n=1 Tax=Sphingomonas sp. TaxID=28214 RepID=UPI0011FF814C|nr:hypothetical protein [Sphingomonas sp.]THD37891.1 MAG: hypothetical protein E7773_02625 [Sphingomonas sp.]